MIKIPTLVLALMTFTTGYCQDQYLIDQLQYGVTLKVHVELRSGKHYEPALNFRVAAAAGVASNWICDELYPSIHTELLFYNGGLGSDNRKGEKNSCKATLDGILAFTLSTGRPNSLFKKQDFQMNRNVPLRYFADFAVPALQNPYNYGFSLGTNFIFSSDRKKSIQRVGFLNVLAAESVQLSYYNDGTPFHLIATGDYRDRYYTGGAVLSYSRSTDAVLDPDSYVFEMSYHKFTGYTQNAFELSNALRTSNVNYKDTTQKYYNKSLWRFSAQMVQDGHNGFGLAVYSYNSNFFDIQHLIHTAINNAYHLVPYEKNNALVPSFFTTNHNFKRH